MRVRFFAPDDEAETRRYMAVVENIDRFWTEFAQAAPRLEAESAERGRWLLHLRSCLARIDAGLGLELGTDSDGLRSCAVLPVKGEHLLPLAELVVEQAPERPPWLFLTRRPALPLTRALSIVRQDCGKDLSSARVRVGVGRGHALSVVVGSEHFEGADDDAAQDAAECLLGRLLGDELYDAWVSDVSVVPQPRKSPLALVGEQSARLPLGLEDLFPAVSAAVEGIVDGLPEQPCHFDCERAEWAMFEVSELTEREHGPGRALQSDLLMASSMRPEMLRCALEGTLFSSERFSRFGEVFCYLKLRVQGESVQQRVDTRLQLEQLLDRALVPGRLGCVVGTGVGTEHVYLVLALTQLEPVIPLLQQRIQGVSEVVAGWLFFCDSAWRHEWVTLSGGTGRPAEH